jgi:hypothetical protein
MRAHRPDIPVAILMLVAGALIATSAAVAQGASPLTFLEAVYKPYRTNNRAKAIDIGKPEVIRRHFAPVLAKAMIKDQIEARKKQEAPLLNGDPFVDAQDWQIADLKIEMISASRRNATGIVTFTNANEPRRMTLDLVKTGDGWRIHEIKTPSGSLRELFKVNRS